MPAPQTPEAILRRLDLKVARRLEGLLQGDHKTSFRGQGLDLADLREYQYHDDVRHMDWNVTARLQIPHVREYLEEREITAWFVLDMSPSIDFESVSVSKRTVLAEFTTLVCRMLTGKGNRAGAMLFAGRVEQVIPARGGRRQLLHILEALTHHRAKRGTTDLNQALSDAARLIRRRSLIFIVSDFISPPGWEKPLGQLASRHDVIAVRLSDPLEARLPNMGLLTFQDSETGEQMFVDTHDRAFRGRFAALAEAREDQLRTAFQNAGVDAIELSTEDDVVDAALRFADMRKHRFRCRRPGMMPMLKQLSWASLTKFLPAISFAWPSLLWLLLLIPLAVGLYVWLLHRRKKFAMRYGNLALVRQAAGTLSWRRHIPPALFLAALTLLIVATARPSAEMTLPSTRATVILAMDVSGSMRAADVNPSRIVAAQNAARQYIKDQPKDVVIGIVAFAATAFLVQNPTVDRDALNAAIDRFELQRGTAVGSAIMMAMSTLFPADDSFQINQYNSPGGGFGGGYGADFYRQRYRGAALGSAPAGGPKKQHVPVEPGSYKNAVIILLTDGQTNAGYDPIEAARKASEYGVKVYTVGFGTTRGDVVRFGGFSMRAQLDEDSLKKIADMTRGRYFHAASADDLKAVYSVLSKQLITETREMEITAFFAAAAAVLMLLGAGLSLAWFNRVI